VVNGTWMPSCTAAHEDFFKTPAAGTPIRDQDAKSQIRNRAVRAITILSGVLSG
jgi:hypothetical protein